MSFTHFNLSQSGHWTEYSERLKRSMLYSAERPFKNNFCWNSRNKIESKSPILLRPKKKIVSMKRPFWPKMINEKNGYLRAVVYLGAYGHATPFGQK